MKLTDTAIESMSQLADQTYRETGNMVTRQQADHVIQLVGHIQEMKREWLVLMNQVEDLKSEHRGFRDGVRDALQTLERNALEPQDTLPLTKVRPLVDAVDGLLDLLAYRSSHPNSYDPLLFDLGMALRVARDDLKLVCPPDSPPRAGGVVPLDPIWQSMSSSKEPHEDA